MKAGKHVEEALRFSYSGANYGIDRENKEIARYTEYRDDYQKRIEECRERLSNYVDQKLEIRATMIKLGLDPEKEL